MSASDAARTHPPAHAHRRTRTVKSPVLATIMPVIACLLCPTCLTVWLPMLSSTGLIVGFKESKHAWVMVVAIGIALASAIYHFVKDRDRVVLTVTALGCTLMGLGEWSGAADGLVALGALCLLSLAIRSIYRELKHGD